jgi:hypothetical protein
MEPESNAAIKMKKITSSNITPAGTINARNHTLLTLK